MKQNKRPIKSVSGYLIAEIYKDVMDILRALKQICLWIIACLNPINIAHAIQKMGLKVIDFSMWVVQLLSQLPKVVLRGVNFLIDWIKSLPTIIYRGFVFLLSLPIKLPQITTLVTKNLSLICKMIQIRLASLWSELINFIKHSPMISLLVALNIGVYIVGNVSADPVAFIMAYAHHPQYLEENWRLLTHMFLHAGYSHIHSNMSALLAMGDVEAHLGYGMFIFSYLLAGLMGALIPQVLGFLTMPAVGASGAIMGMVAINYLLPSSRFAMNAENENHHWAKAFKSLMVSTILDLGLVCSGMPIGWMCHMFGAMTGIVIYSGIKRFDAWQSSKRERAMAKPWVNLSDIRMEKAASFNTMDAKPTSIGEAKVSKDSQTEIDDLSVTSSLSGC